MFTVGLNTTGVLIHLKVAEYLLAGASKSEPEPKRPGASLDVREDEKRLKINTFLSH